MAKVMVGDDGIFEHFHYVENSPAVGQFIEREYQRARDTFGHHGQALIDRSYQVYQDIKNSDAVRIAKAAMHRMQSYWVDNMIACLKKPHQVQNAPPVMRPFVMAEPTLRKLWQQQRVDGYGSDYISSEPNAVGEDHREWRMVMDGMATVHDDGSWEATSWADSELLDEEHLSTDDQYAILDTWETIRNCIADGVDPTSKWGADL